MNDENCVINEKGLVLERWDRDLLRALGDAPGNAGSGVLGEAITRGCRKVAPRHWLYALAKVPRGLIRMHVIDPTGYDPEKFIDTVEECLPALEPSPGGIPRTLSASTVTADVLKLLDYAAGIVRQKHLPAVTEAALTLALLDYDVSLRKVLQDWARERQFQLFVSLVNARLLSPAEELAGDDLFDTYLISSTDVRDWLTVCKVLVHSAAEPAGTLWHALWARLRPDLQQEIKAALSTLNADHVRHPLRRALNELLKRDDWHKDLDPLPASFAPSGESFPHSPSLLNADAWNRQLCNRRALEAALPAGLAAAGRRVGKLRQSRFDQRANRFFVHWREDMAALGARQVTTSHLLYSLLGGDSSLTQALSLRGVDVKRELHALLTHKIARAGAKRNADFELAADTLLGGVTDVLLHALKLAAAHKGPDALASELDICRAFMHRSPQTLRELFPPQKPLDTETLKDYLDTCEEPLAEDEPPLQKITIDKIEALVNSRIRGQDQAVAQVLPWIRRLRFGLPRDNRPAAVFLLLGPTGTGKTQLARELARYVYGSEDAMLFLEMGQFQTKESMSGFIGAPPGYVGYGEGKLTNGLRDKPECVVLFDEIEKANASVFDTLLRFADEGIISDPAGPIRDGRRCTIVMTTNAGQRWLQEEYLKMRASADDSSDAVEKLAQVRQALGLHSQLLDTITAELRTRKLQPDKPPQAGELVNDDILADRLALARRDAELPGKLLAAAIDELLSKGFRPEFIGRVDERITLLPLDLSTCRAITADVLASEARKLHEIKGLKLFVDDKALDVLARMAMVRSLSEGVRGVPRTVNECVINRIIILATEAEEYKKSCVSVSVYADGPDKIKVIPQ